MYKKPLIKKAIGIVLILVGFVAFVTPFTPGSWLVFIGLELLGVRILFFDKLKVFTKNLNFFVKKKEVVSVEESAFSLESE
jgi:uncharacterized protein YqgC (DUF456 family)